MTTRLDARETKAWFESVLDSNFGPVVWSGANGKCRCPFHEDNNPSFSVSIEKGAFVCFGCGAKGGLKDLAEHLGVPSPYAQHNNAPRKSTEYLYRDEGGVLKYRVLRIDEGGKKSISQQPPDGTGGWKKGQGCMKGVKPIPYRLDVLAARFAEGKKSVIIAEGEKCVESLVAHGFSGATTNHGGAGKWYGEHTKHIPADAQVVICPDADATGMKHARNVALQLLKKGCRVKVLDLGYPMSETHGKDIADWFAAGGTKEQLVELIKQTPAWSDEDTVKAKEAVVEEKKEKREKEEARLSVSVYRVVGGYRMSDFGNAQRLVDAHGQDIRYCSSWKRYLIWTGVKWDDDAQYMVTRMYQNIAKDMFNDADSINDFREREQFLAFATSSENSNRIKAAIEIARDLPGIPIRPSELDAGKDLLNCENGTLNLTTGYFKPHDRNDLITKLAKVKWDEDAKCPTWDRFISQIMMDNPRLTGFLQRSIGYALTGFTSEQCFFILHGIGSNGKSTLISTLKSILGDYARQASADTFMAKCNNNSGPGDNIAMLRSARFVSATETEQSQNLAEALIKQLTGGDIVSVRRLYENFFEFEPEFKIFLATNHKPNIRGTDNGIWRRIRFIPFNASIPESQVDKDLPAKLREEASGILAWAVRGCLEWQENGLQEPPEIKRATAEYRSDMDVIGAFLEEKCEISDSHESELYELYSVSSAEIFEAYKKWAEKNGEREISQTRLAQRLKDRGIQKTRLGSNVRGWQGIRLRPYYM